MRLSPKQPGFSLAEVLITLAILGIIATFTIPKLLNTPNSTLSSKYTAMAKDATYMILSAYEQWRQAGGVVQNCVTSLDDLTPYMNYVSISTSGQIDERGDLGGALTCSAQYPCLKLHNGAVLQGHYNAYRFPRNTALSSLWISFDPDGTYTGKNDTLHIALYADGSIRHRETVKTNTLTVSAADVGSCALTGKGPAGSNVTPAWFTGF